MLISVVSSRVNVARKFHLTDHTNYSITTQVSWLVVNWYRRPDSRYANTSLSKAQFEP